MPERMNLEHEIQIDPARCITLRLHNGALTLALEDPGTVAVVELTDAHLDELANTGLRFASAARDARAEVRT